MLKELYPEITEFNSFMLETNSKHRVYVEEAGNISGTPILFLHGGPGSGCNSNHRRYFNPEKFENRLIKNYGSVDRAPSTEQETLSLEKAISKISQKNKFPVN